MESIQQFVFDHSVRKLREAGISMERSKSLAGICVQKFQTGELKKGGDIEKWLETQANRHKRIASFQNILRTPD